MSTVRHSASISSPLLQSGMALLVAVNTMLVLGGCANSGERERRAAEEARQRQLPSLRAELRAKAEARLRAGETPPPRDDDPGYEIASCAGVSPIPTKLAVGLYRVVCGNSEQGARIVAYRQWYCGDAGNDCVYSDWRADEPTFAPYYGGSTTFQWPKDGVIYRITLTRY